MTSACRSAVFTQNGEFLGQSLDRVIASNLRCFLLRLKNVVAAETLAVGFFVQLGQCTVISCGQSKYLCR